MFSTPASSASTAWWRKFSLCWNRCLNRAAIGESRKFAFAVSRKEAFGANQTEASEADAVSL
jgi:hypothetical protein